jgi:acyl-CoA synthetase (NDP forming)
MGIRSVYPVNPSEDEILGIKAYRTIERSGSGLGHFYHRLPLLRKLMEDCGQKGVRAGIVPLQVLGGQGSPASEGVG